MLGESLEMVIRRDMAAIVETFEQGLYRTILSSGSWS